MIKVKTKTPWLSGWLKLPVILIFTFSIGSLAAQQNEAEKLVCGESEYSILLATGNTNFKSTARLNVRVGPSKKCRIIEVLSNNQAVTKLKHIQTPEREWAYIRWFEEGVNKFGWASGKFLDQVGPAQTPIAKEPLVEKPAVEKPAVEKPVVEKPAVEKPVVEKPVVEKPVVEKPVVEKPVVEKPVVEKPVVEKPVETRGGETRGGETGRRRSFGRRTELRTINSK